MTDKNKTYFYFRNGLLHIRHMADEAVALSDFEVESLKKKIEENPAYKQKILREEWAFQTLVLNKQPENGIAMADRVIDRLCSKYGGAR